MKTSISTLRKYAKRPATIDTGRNGDKPVFYYFGEQFENENFVHEILSLRYTGWLTNEEGETYRDGSGLARGIVVTLPRSPGFSDGRFLAGYWWGDNDEMVLFPDIFSDKEEAARYADSYAERFAEDQREDNAKWNEARRLEDKNEEARERLAECLKLARINHKREEMREEARELIARIRENRETLKRDFADYL